MRWLIAATCSAGVAIAIASPAFAGAPPPTVPSDAAIAQYIEVVPSATGLVPTGEAPPAAEGAALPTALRAKVEKTAGADAPPLLRIAQDPRFRAPPERRTRAARQVPRPRADPAPAPRQAVPESIAAPTPSPLAAAASTAGSDGLLLVALMLVAITAAGIAAKALPR